MRHPFYKTAFKSLSFSVFYKPIFINYLLLVYNCLPWIFRGKINLGLRNQYSGYKYHKFDPCYLMRLSSREVGREPLRGRILVIYYIILSLYPKQDSLFNGVNLIWNRTDPLHQHEWRAASTGSMARPDFLQYLAYYRPIWLTPLAWLSMNGLHEDYKKILLSSSPDPQKVKKNLKEG